MTRCDPGTPLGSRLLRRSDRTGECWLWTGATTPNGYGRLTVDGIGWLAHRLAYEVWVGPIPDGMHLDHLCRVRLCIRPEHLEAVTQTENNRRISGGVCRAGLHELPALVNGRRRCRECTAAYMRDYNRAYYIARRDGTPFVPPARQVADV